MHYLKTCKLKLPNSKLSCKVTVKRINRGAGGYGLEEHLLWP